MSLAVRGCSSFRVVLISRGLSSELVSLIRGCSGDLGVIRCQDVVGKLDTGEGVKVGVTGNGVVYFPSSSYFCSEAALRGICLFFIGRPGMSFCYYSIGSSVSRGLFPVPRGEYCVSECGFCGGYVDVNVFCGADSGDFFFSRCLKTKTSFNSKRRDSFISDLVCSNRGVKCCGKLVRMCRPLPVDRVSRSECCSCTLNMKTLVGGRMLLEGGCLFVPCFIFRLLTELLFSVLPVGGHRLF